MFVKNDTDMMPVQDQIAKALLAFINAKTWIEQKQIVEENAALLLTGEAERLLENPLRRYANDAARHHHILESRDLLAKCRSEGIDKAFDDLLEPSPDDRFVELLNIFSNFNSAGTWQDRKVYLEHHPELLSDEMLEFLDQLIQESLDEQEGASALEDYRELLTWCRDKSIGVDLAFSMAEFADHMLMLQALMKANNWSERKAFLEEHPELLTDEAVLETLDSMIKVKQEKNDQDAVRFLQEHGHLITQCRNHGIDVAFADYGKIVPFTYLSDLTKEIKSLTDTNQIPRRIEVCREMLTLIERTEEPNRWAMIHNELGDILVKSREGDQAQNIEEAIAHLNFALEVFQPDTIPEDWGKNQHDLGQAYRKRIRGEREDNLEKSIHHYLAALTIFSRQKFPEEWVIIQENIEMAYWDLREFGIRWKNIEKAIEHLQLALLVRTAQNSPGNWATIQYNLGIAFYCRIYGQREENLKQALKHLYEAAKIYTQQDHPEKWAKVRQTLEYTKRDMTLLETIVKTA